MGKKKNQTSGIGRSIIKDRFGHGKRQKSDDTFLHTSDLNDGYDWGRLNLQSVTEQSNLDEFLTTAQLAGTEFTAEKLNIKFIDPKRAPGLSEEERRQIKDAQEEHRKLLSIPRRPSWDENTTAEQLDLMERDAFLEWRRTLASLQEVEHIVMTPYEKNLDFWRQLWRVVERSDVVVQIVDARNPLLFRCEDIETYVREVDPGKVNLLLVNKADYLTPQQRCHWSDYFTKNNIRVVFWSALEEANRLKEEAKEAEMEANMEEDEAVESSDNNGAEATEAEAAEDESDNKGAEAVYTEAVDAKAVDAESDSKEAEAVDTEAVDAEAVDAEAVDAEAVDAESDSKVAEAMKEDNMDSAMDCESSPNKESDSKSCSHSESSHSQESSHSETVTEESDISKFNSSNIVTGPELLDILGTLHTGEKYKGDVTTVGMIGYPNVGKSSTINAILQMKKVPVSATPGRTKHFQTLFVDSTLMLCDCPGLVFPSFVSTKADLVVNGILPIDQMRDHVPPVSLVCERIPQCVLESTYSINIPLPEDLEDLADYDRPTAHELLNTYGMMRGYMTSNGLPDCPRSARYILKDYVNGKLLYCQPPPGVEAADFQPTPQPQESTPCNILEDQLQLKAIVPTTSLDKEFFSKTRVSAHSKGVQGVTGFVRAQGLQQVSSTNRQTSQEAKPWKKHGNRQKKEKLRRIHSDLDRH